MTGIDLLIIGAGPAGVSAAVEATSHGLSTLVLDENPAPGGRIWQALEQRGADDADDDEAIRALRAFRACAAETHYRATVWAIEPDNTVYWSQDNTSRSVRALRILLATGTTERPVPIPGWTLPGVMTVGAAQIALKTGGLIPDQNTWVAGQGPLLLLYAVQAIRAGGRLGGILDLSAPGIVNRALPHLPRAIGAAGDLLKGLRWRRAIARAGVPVLRVSDLRAEGDNPAPRAQGDILVPRAYGDDLVPRAYGDDPTQRTQSYDQLRRITFQQAGSRRTETCDTLLLHDGVIPSVQITRALGCSHAWSNAQQCWHPVVDPWGQTSLPGIHIAGDGAGIGGAKAAIPSGRIAALGIAHALGRIDAATRDAAAAGLRRTHSRHLAIRPLLDAAYTPLAAAPDDETLVCRCEEVTAAQIRRAAAIGCLGLNQLKAYTRCGMGPCQGRMCAPTAAAVLAAARGVPVQTIDPLRTRFPTKPVTVGELASLPSGAQPAPVAGH